MSPPNPPSASSPAPPGEPALLVHSRALGDPTRHAIFGYLRASPGPVGVAELTEHFGLNHNAIRQHLAKLRDAGLVVDEPAPRQGRGRPALRYRPTPGALDRWEGPGPHEVLSVLLVEVLRGDGTPREVGQRAGRRLARQHREEGDAVAVLEAVARRLGFEPRRVETAAGAEVVLDRCPFVGAAAAAPEIVCELHRGIAEGVAAAAFGRATVVGLEVHPPRRAGCRLQVARAGAELR